jgi:hypothetical protein
MTFWLGCALIIDMTGPFTATSEDGDDADGAFPSTASTPTAQRGNAFLATKALDHDSDLLFGREAPARLPSDLSNCLLGGILLLHGSFSFRSQNPLLDQHSIWSKLS